MRYASRYGYYMLEPFPGNPAIAVSKSAVVYKRYRGKGHGKRQHIARLKEARRLGYRMLLATVRLDNAAEQALLEKMGWTRLAGFYSPIDEQDVALWGIVL